MLTSTNLYPLCSFFGVWVCFFFQRLNGTLQTRFALYTSGCTWEAFFLLCSERGGEEELPDPDSWKPVRVPLTPHHVDPMNFLSSLAPVAATLFSASSGIPHRWGKN